MRKGLIGVALVLMWIATAHAEPQSTEVSDVSTVSDAAPVETLRLKQDMPKAEGTDMGAASAQMVMGLAAVLAVIFALAWLARRFNLAAAGVTANMKVVSALSVGQKEKILLLEVEGQRLLVGVTAHQIALLQTMGPAPENASGSDFANRMQVLLKAGTLNEK